jgi:hypothetical protein
MPGSPDIPGTRHFAFAVAPIKSNLKYTDAELQIESILLKDVALKNVFKEC